MTRTTIKITHKDVDAICENVKKRLCMESVWDDDYEEEVSGFDRYKADYKDEDFDVDSIRLKDLLDYCLSNDFLYIINTPLRGWRVCAANTEDIQHEIVSDICKYGFERSHDADIHMSNKPSEFEGCHVVIFHIPTVEEDGGYYIVYQLFE